MSAASAAGVISANFSSTAPQSANSAINGSTLSYSATPVAGGGTLNFTRRSTAGGTVKTNIANKYLPTVCRK